MSRESPVVECRGVSKAYRTETGAVSALQAVDLSAGRSSITALVGRSGSGKSTLLRLLAALDQADGGSIAVVGRDVIALHGAPARRYRRACVAYAAQRAAANLVPHLTVREQLGADAEVAWSLGVGARVDARADQLSGGEQARAALAVALARRTPVLLLDEPTAELDRASAQLVVDALRAAADDGRTVVLATHDPDLLELATTVVDLAPSHTPVHARRARLSADADVALSVRGVTKSYGAAVVDDATLDVRRGEIGLLLGRSGSGKSTLLMAAGGWLAPDSGSVTVAGETSTPPAWDALAYLAQRFALLPELTVRENIELPLRLAQGRDDATVDSLLERLSLAELSARRPDEISIGQQQRAALARALVCSPTVLLADEPTSHQDVASAELVWDAFAAAADAGTACLVATHDETAAPRGDRVWHIADGRIGAAPLA